MSDTRFILSSTEPWDTTYRTQEGQVIYKVEAAAPTLGARDIKISKIIPSLDNQIQDGEAENLRDSFAHLATVEYHKIRSSRIRMGDLDISTDDYFSKEGWSLKNFGRLVVFLLWRRNVSQL